MHRSKCVHIKANALVCRAELGRLPTRDALVRRNIQLHTVECLLCNIAEESVLHNFTSCYFAISLWQLISQWCKIPLFMHAGSKTYCSYIKPYKVIALKKSYDKQLS